MKARIFVTLSTFLFVLVACKKVDRSMYLATPRPVVNTSEFKLKVAVVKGLKCHLSNENEQKEVFLEFTKNEADVTTLQIHDFLSAYKIHFLFSVFDGYTLMPVILQTTSQDEVLEGTVPLIYKDKALLTQEGESSTISGKITWNKTEKTAVIESKLYIIKSDSTVEITPYKELGIINECESFEAQK